MKVINLTILILLSIQASGQQKDYLKLRPSVMVLVCGAPDSSTVNNSIRNLLALDTNHITRHMERYYIDLGQCYWLKSKARPGDLFLQLSIETTRKALYHKSNATIALWNLAVSYYAQEDCNNGKYFLGQFKRYSNRKEWDDNEMQMMMSSCGS